MTTPERRSATSKLSSTPSQSRGDSMRSVSTGMVSSSNQSNRMKVQRDFPDFYAVLIERIGEEGLKTQFSTSEWEILFMTLSSGKWDFLLKRLIADDYEGLLELQEELLAFYEDEYDFIRIFHPWFAGLVGIEVWNNDIEHLRRPVMGEVIGFVHSVAAAQWFASKVEEPQELESILNYRGSYESAGIALVLYAIEGYEKIAIATILALEPQTLKEDSLIIISRFDDKEKIVPLAKILVQRGEVSDLNVFLIYGKISMVALLVDAISDELIKVDVWNEEQLAMIDELRKLSYYKLSLLPDGEMTAALRLEDEIHRRGL